MLARVSAEGSEPKSGRARASERAGAWGSGWAQARAHAMVRASVQCWATGRAQDSEVSWAESTAQSWAFGSAVALGP